MQPESSVLPESVPDPNAVLLTSSAVSVNLSLDPCIPSWWQTSQLLYPQSTHLSSHHHLWSFEKKKLSWWTFLFTQHRFSLATGALPLGWGVNDCTRLTSTHLSRRKAEHLAKADQSECTVPQVKQLLVTRNLIQTWPTSVNPKVLLTLSEKRVSLFFNINTYKNNKAPHGKPARGKANTEESRAEYGQESSSDLPA